MKSKLEQIANESVEVHAECRGCARRLIGKPYYMGGPAYIPETRERARVNFFGGFVCSLACDRRVSLGQLSSMPGAGEATQLDSHTLESLNRNWEK